MLTLLLTLEKHPSAQVIQSISEFLQEIIRKEAFNQPDIHQGILQLFSLDSNHFSALRELLPSEMLSQI